MRTLGFFESLETRKFLSATLDPVTHVLTVTGGAGATNDKIDISISPPPTPGTPPSPTNAPKLVVEDKVAHVTKTFNLQDVHSIVVKTGDGNDEVNVAPGVRQPTSIDLGGGDDKAHGGSGPTQIFGGPGKDTLAGGDGRDLLVGGDGDDQLLGGGNDDVLRGGKGADLFNGGAGIDLADYAGATVNLVISIDGVANDGATGEGDNVLTSVENIDGGSGNDSLTGSASRNRIDGRAGNDTIKGFAENDDLIGGIGNDKLDGGSGADHLDGGEGSDSLTGGSGRDLLVGGIGNDYFFAADGEIDTLAGGAGTDVKTADATDVLHDIP